MLYSCRHCSERFTQTVELERHLLKSHNEGTLLSVTYMLSMRLDYYSLLCGISDTLLRRLQSVQNAAARVITRTPRRDHITPILHHLHWLPVRQRVAFKLAVLVYKALNNRAPVYLSQDCLLVGDTGRRELRSSHNYTCASVTTSTRFGDRTFARVISGTRKFDRGLSRIIRDDLHWLNVSQRVTFKVCMTVYKWALVDSHAHFEGDAL